MEKAVILAAGLGTRMKEEDASAELTEEQAAVAATGVKALIPINGQPFLNYVLSALVDSGYRKVCVVIGPAHEEVRGYYESLDSKRLAIEFAIQEKPLGGADALLTAESFAEDYPFLVINSDNYYPAEVLSAIRELDGPGLVAFRADSLLKGGSATVERITNCALLEADDRGYLVGLIEKPDPERLEGMSDPIWVSMTCWRFSSSIFRACRAIGLSERGEYELPDAVAWTIDTLGERYRMIPSDALVLDLSRRANIRPVEERLEGVEVAL